MWLHVPFVGRNQVGRGGQPRQTTSPPPSPPPLPPTHPRPPPAPHPTPSTHSLTPLVASPPGTNGACGGWELAFPFDGERAAVTAPCRRSCPPFCCPGLLLNKSLARFPRHVVTKMPAYAGLDAIYGSRTASTRNITRGLFALGEKHCRRPRRSSKSYTTGQRRR